MSGHTSHIDLFEHHCNLLREFIVFRERLPRRSSINDDERSLGRWISRQRSAQGRGKLSEERAAVINNINNGILAFKSHLDINNHPSALWEKFFNDMAGRNTEEELRAYTFATTNQPFIPTTSPARSFEEFMIRKMQCYQHFSPQECTPHATSSTMQKIFSYAIHPESRPTHHLRSSTSRYIKNVFDPLNNV